MTSATSEQVPAVAAAAFPQVAAARLAAVAGAVVAAAFPQVAAARLAAAAGAAVAAEQPTCTLAPSPD